MKGFHYFTAVCFFTVQGLSGAPREIINDTVWHDTKGREIFAQGGSMVQVGNRFYWYGYEIKKNDVRLYTSTDFVHWEFQGVVFDADVWHGRPEVIFNDSTKQYVMITEGPLSGGRNSVQFLTSHSPSGPFIRQAVVDNVFGHKMGDHGVFKDSDGTAYLLAVFDPSKNKVNGGIKIIKLTSDYLGLHSVVASWQNDDHREAPFILRKDGSYFLFTSYTQGWNSTATKYQKSATLSGLASAPEVVLATIPQSNDSFNTQTDFFVPISGSQGTSWIYCGDRYSQFTGKGIGKNAWFPLEFDRSGTPLLNGLQKWTIDAETGLWSFIKPDPPSIQ